MLCYLQGLTYAAAAHQLGLSEVAIQGRLARARDGVIVARNANTFDFVSLK